MSEQTLLPDLILLVLTLVPSWRLMQRIGKSPPWALVCIIPLGFLVPLWVAAFAKWKE